MPFASDPALQLNQWEMFSIVKPADKSNGRLSDYKGNKVGQPFNQEMIPTDCDNEYTFPRLQGLLEILTFFRLYKNRTISSIQWYVPSSGTYWH